ncbi:MAG: hypothetical protein AAB425_00710, partial [Bdellovibrionota bacterium]
MAKNHTSRLLVSACRARLGFAMVVSLIALPIQTSKADDETWLDRQWARLQLEIKALSQVLVGGRNPLVNADRARPSPKPSL